MSSRAMSARNGRTKCDSLFPAVAPKSVFGQITDSRSGKGHLQSKTILLGPRGSQAQAGSLPDVLHPASLLSHLTGWIHATLLAAGEQSLGHLDVAGHSDLRVSLQRFTK